MASEVDQLALLLGELRAEVHAARSETSDLMKELVVNRERTEELARRLTSTQAGQTPSSAEGAAAASQIQVTTPVTVPLAPPERFLGDPLKYGVFMTHCRLHFLCRPGAFPTDQTKVAFILSYPGGHAASWSVPLVDRDDPVLDNFAQFQQEMDKLFSRRTRGHALDA
ncbi:protein LDOC1-like [Ambystoma mexicanum]|uniref:protein LDOC1-like n=1 Tax=Ambystoma mexicanum TaxID=8296 RepID=UPI0037E84C8F